MMKNKVSYLVFFLVFTFQSSCSLPSERKITLEELKRSKKAAYYIIEDDPEGVVKILNEKGEVVVRATLGDDPVYVKIFSTSDGFFVKHFDRDVFVLEDE